MRGFGKRDFDIHREILSELEWEPGIESTQVGVQVDRGIATLLGNVSSLRMREAAERAARRVEGVRAVVDELVVRVAETHGPNQADVARAIADALLGPSGSEDTDIEIIVDNNDVILEGCVPSTQERRRIEQAVRRLTTNQEIVNRLVVSNAFADGALVHRAIQQALVEQAASDARMISVEVDDCKVLLRGTVRDDGVRDQAARAALVPGVEQVQNLLIVEHQRFYEETQRASYASADAQ